MYLTKRAYQTIEGICFSDSNYYFAVKILQEMFRHSDVLVFKHLDQLLALPQIHSSMDVTGLRELHDRLQFTTGAWEASEFLLKNTPSF